VVGDLSIDFQAPGRASECGMSSIEKDFPIAPLSLRLCLGTLYYSMEALQDQEEFGVVINERVTSWERAQELITELQCLNPTNCNVAIPLKSFFDACYADPKATTVELTDQILKDFEQLIAGPKMSESSRVAKRFKFVDLILGLMEWYQGQDRLNLILMPSSLENNNDAKQYIRWPAQKARELRNRQQVFQSVSVRYEAETKRLGIFCDRTPHKYTSTFLGKLVNNLSRSKSSTLVVNFPDIPPAYQANKGLLKQALKRKFPERSVELFYRGDSVIISLRP
jgi:hypothetical protein